MYKFNSSKLMDLGTKETCLRKSEGSNPSSLDMMSQHGLNYLSGRELMLRHGHNTLGACTIATPVSQTAKQTPL